MQVIIRLAKRLLAPLRSRLLGDFDYRRAYRRANLDLDHWSIVGPASREEFERLGRIKLEMLIEQGLTPHSHVLDVGCGTGQLTAPLEEFLSPHGLYHGTDLAEEAVAFCRQKFFRPNFSFSQNSMTRVPLRGLTFDCIYLGSVFTHMYPDEIAALLTDLRRLLAEDGQILADLFLSARVNRWAGHRGMVRINEDHIRRLVAGACLTIGELNRWSWQPNVKRAVWRFRHAPDSV